MSIVSDAEHILGTLQSHLPSAGLLVIRQRLDRVVHSEGEKMLVVSVT